ncbi:ABC transporter ATP-binding protein [Nonomuraea diastatica]|uniref:ABC transporter ATP-binding protein n=1 Tax=Nonomuraea diastatica TaxID=1848329 RepID=UPI0015F2C0DF|nr:ABC transporter ATP-binding protein [Nonomuraea diastatica]
MIVIDDVRVRIDGAVLIDGVDLTVPPGRNEQSVHALRPQALARRIAYVPQDTALSFPFTAYQVTLMGRHAHVGRFALEGRADHRAAEQAMAATGTTWLADRNVATLSGGERQLVLLAKALAQDAQVLLADEPVSALDLRHRLAVLRLLRACADAGRAVLDLILLLDEPTSRRADEPTSRRADEPRRHLLSAAQPGAMPSWTVRTMNALPPASS